MRRRPASWEGGGGELKERRYCCVYGAGMAGNTGLDNGAIFTRCIIREALEVVVSYLDMSMRVC